MLSKIWGNNSSTLTDCVNIGTHIVTRAICSKWLLDEGRDGGLDCVRTVNINRIFVGLKN